MTPPHFATRQVIVGCLTQDDTALLIDALDHYDTSDEARVLSGFLTSRLLLSERAVAMGDLSVREKEPVA